MTAITGIKLNKSQKEIALSEQAAAGSALNTISVKLRLPDFNIQQVKSAAETVFMQSDVFSASISHDCDRYCFIPVSYTHLDVYKRQVMAYHL